MDTYGAARKRGRPQGAIGNGGIHGFKRPKETDSSQHALGSKSKPCTKFFSTTGCSFGEGCHFLHYVPGGYNAVAQMSNPGSSALPPASRNPVAPPANSSRPQTPAAKTRLCSKFNTPEGCRFGEKCHFAHGERELGRPLGNLPSGRETAIAPPLGGRIGGWNEAPAPPVGGAAASFGASATAKISVDASLAGAIIGKGGANTKQVCRMSGAKLSIRDHESDPNLRNIEMEGTFEQIKQATAMVRELIVNLGSTTGAPAAAPVKEAPAAGLGYGAGHGHGVGGGAHNFKTKMCEKFAKGTCTFGERCHFAHGPNELVRRAAA